MSDVQVPRFMGLSFPPTLLGVLMLLWVGVGCVSSEAPSEEGSAAVSALPVPVLLSERRSTTDASIAVTNLEAQVEAARSRLRSAASPEGRALLFELLSLRIQFLGRYSDFEELQALGDAAERETDPAERLVSVRADLAVHRFQRAKEKIEVLRQQGVDVEEVELTLDVALHQNLERWLEISASTAELAPSFSSLSRRASVLLTAGRFEEADAAFQSAEDAYRDVSPFPLAWLAFQRGLMWSERAGRSEVGLAYYRRALEYLPQFVVAGVHRAELESERTRIRALLEQAAVGEDPEPWGKLSTFFEVEDPQRADEYRQRAHEAYVALLDVRPLAFADHASEFYRGAGRDPNRSLELARVNLDNRETPRSLLIVWAAAEAASERETLCELLRHGRRFDVQHPVLAEDREARASDCQ